MNAEYEKQLEAGVRRELNALGELEAPAEIARRVMRVIEQRAAKPWHQRAWQTWPLAFRAVSFAGLLAAFSFLCFGSWRLGHFASLTSAAREVCGWFSLADTVWSAVNALVTALVLAFRNRALRAPRQRRDVVDLLRCVRGVGNRLFAARFCAPLRERHYEKDHSSPAAFERRNCVRRAGSVRCTDQSRNGGKQ